MRLSQSSIGKHRRPCGYSSARSVIGAAITGVLFSTQRRFINVVIIPALKKSINNEPTSGTIMKATGAGP